MNEFLKDKTFLLKLNHYHVKEYSAAVMVLDFETEKPICRLEGKIVSGNMSISANSSVRRTGSFSLVFDTDLIQLTDLNNIISINKKISLSVGITNPYYHTAEYAKYGTILWFKQGLFIITKASTTTNTTSSSVSMEIIDKMGMLNGTCGGTLPASTSFHDKIIIDKDQNITTLYPLISEIIRECVHHFGGEDFSRIIIDDVPEVGRRVARYVGSTPININNKGNYKIAQPPVTDYKAYYKNQDIGYMEVPLVYPGELIIKAGQNVCTVLDEIVKTLGNYEYFYDVEGNFHFQQIRNFDKTGRTPLIDVGMRNDPNDPLPIPSEEKGQKILPLYFPKFNDDQYISELMGTSLLISLNQSPNYSNIKNDFTVWGSRKKDDNDQWMCRYHLAIDKRPEDSPEALCHQDIRKIIYSDTLEVSRYRKYGADLNPGEEWSDDIAPRLDDIFPNVAFDWREELFRQALLAYGSSTEATFYDQELMAEWRLLYDPSSTIINAGPLSFQGHWQNYYGVGGTAPPWTGYNVDIQIAPEKIRYWLDLIDSDSTFGAYSVNRIGRRAIVEENSKINEVFATEINDLVFLENDLAKGVDSNAKKQIPYYISIGQAYSLITSDLMSCFQYRNSFGTCFEQVRQSMYDHLIYNTQISLTCIPILYMDVNSIVRLNYPELGCTGDYIITQIGWNLGHANTMSITAHEAIVVV